MKTTFPPRYGLLLLLALSLSACRLDDFEGVEGFSYEAEFALPLLNTSVTVQDLLDRSDNSLSSIEVREDQSLWLRYEDEAEVIDGGEVLDDFPASFPLPIDEQEVAYSLANRNGIGIEMADLRSGTLRFEWRSPHPDDLDLTITFPGILRNNQPLVVQAFIAYQDGGPNRGSIPPIDLNGYSVRTNEGDLEINYRALDQNGIHRDLDPLTAFAENWIIDRVQGTWQNIDIPLEQNELDVDLYNSQVEGELYFSNPRLVIEVNNSFGVPVLMSTDFFYVEMEDGSTLSVENEFVEEGFWIEAPTSAGTSRRSTFVLDRDNSNITDIFNGSPSRLIYQPNLVVAPGAPATGFITAASQVDVAVRFELPIEGSARNFTVDSSTELNFDAEEGQELKAAQLKLITENQLPLEAQIQIYFTDAQEQKIDSVFSDFQAVLVANGPPTTTLIDIDEEQLDHLRESERLLVRARLSTTGEGSSPVSIRADQEMTIKLGLRATVQQ